MPKTVSDLINYAKTVLFDSFELFSFRTQKREDKRSKIIHSFRVELHTENHAVTIKFDSFHTSVKSAGGDMESVAGRGGRNCLMMKTVDGDFIADRFTKSF